MGISFFFFFFLGGKQPQTMETGKTIFINCGDVITECGHSCNSESIAKHPKCSYATAGGVPPLEFWNKVVSTFLGVHQNSEWSLPINTALNFGCPG